VGPAPALRGLAELSAGGRYGEPLTCGRLGRGGVNAVGSWPSRGGGHGAPCPMLGGWCVLHWRRRHTGFLGGAVGTNWWCTGFIAHLPCGSPSVRQLLQSGQVPSWVSLVATVPDAGVRAHVRRGGGVFGESPSSAGSGSMVPLPLASAAARPPRRVRTPGPTVAGPRRGTRLSAGIARRGGRW
jgi:hypothetical protein